MNLKKIAVGLGFLVVITGCAPVKYVVDDSFVGGRNVKTLMTPTAIVDSGGGAGTKGVTLYDYQIRLCDVDASGAESNCATSTVLNNVVAPSIGF